MTSTFTTNKSLEKPANSDYVNDWDLPVNTDWDAIDTCFGGYTVLNPTGLSGLIALTSTNNPSPPPTSKTTQWQAPNIIVGASQTASAVLTANVNYQFPSGVGGRWSILNNTTGAFSVTFSSAGGGTSQIIPQGRRVAILCDGTNVLPDSNGTSAGTWAMAEIRLLGATNGFVDLKSPASSGSQTFILPAADGSANQVLSTDGSGNLGWANAAGGTFSGGSTGLTPNTPTSAAVLGGVLNTANGGTGNTTGQPSGLAGGVLNGSYPSPGMVPGAAVTNIGYTPVNKAGDTMSGTLTQTAPGLYSNTVASGARTQFWATSGSFRWAMGLNSDAESGGNAGSTFFLNRYSDAGSFIDTPVAISRATGLVTLADGLTVTGTTTSTAFSGPLTGNVTGNASTASALQTARSFTFTGIATGGPTNFDGSANVSIALTGNFGTTAGTIAQGNDARFGGPPLNSQSGPYTLALTDAGDQIYHPTTDTTARTWTIPANGSVAFPIGTQIDLVNDAGAGVITIAITTDSLVWAPNAGTGTRTLTAPGWATIKKVTATRWMIAGNNLA